MTARRAPRNGRKPPKKAYAPTVAEWQRLADAQVTTLTVTRATFEEGRPTAHGCPFVRNPLEFSIVS